eukprot:COSAG01_NODE_13281_length_1607_cov_3.791114_3_plen_50_part_01
MRVHWVAVPKEMRARRVNRENKSWAFVTFAKEEVGAAEPLPYINLFIWAR